jgi:hypothetical protein
LVFITCTDVDQFTWPGQIPGGRTYIDPSTSPEQGWVFATGTFTGIISQIEFDEVELVLNLNKADYQGSIQSVIRNWNANTAAISMLEVLPLDLPFCLLYAMNRAQVCESFCVFGKRTSVYFLLDFIGFISG